MNYIVGWWPKQCAFKEISGKWVGVASNFISFWDAVDFILKIWRANLTLIWLRFNLMNWPTYRPVRWKLGQPRKCIQKHHESLSDEIVINWGNLRFELVLFFQISRSNTSNRFLCVGLTLQITMQHFECHYRVGFGSLVGTSEWELRFITFI